MQQKEKQGESEFDPWKIGAELGAPRQSKSSSRGRLDALFRSEAIEARQQQWLGEILIARPVQATIFASIAMCIAVAIVFFLVWGEYTRKESVSGEVQTSLGVSKIMSPVYGVVTRRLVNENQDVKAGDPLFIVSVERSTLKGETQATQLKLLSDQKRKLSAELRKEREISAEESVALTAKIENTRRESKEIQQNILLQEKRIELSENVVKQYQELLRSNFITSNALLDKEREHLDAMTRMSDLRRQQIEIQRTLHDLESAQKNFPRQAENKLSQISRQLSALDQSETDIDGKREIIIPAPHSGRIVAILAQAGQTLSLDRPMATLLPTDALLEGHLYAPSRAIGFIREGSLVNMRYEAYPYQKFGQYGGKVIEISRAAIPPAELPFTIRTDEPLYRIRVALDSPMVLAYGKQEFLQSGMRLEADVQIDTRKLYEWVLEPLYSLSGRV